MPRGSKPGERRGGRKAGTKNVASSEREKAIEASGLTPLAYMLSTLRDVGQPVNVRLDAAKAAAQYVHPRLSAVEVKAEIINETHDDAREVRNALLLGAATTAAPGETSGAE